MQISYGRCILVKYTAKRSVSIVGIFFQTRSNPLNRIE